MLIEGCALINYFQLAVRVGAYKFEVGAYSNNMVNEALGMYVNNDNDNTNNNNNNIINNNNNNNNNNN